MANGSNDTARRIGRRIATARTFRGWGTDELAARAGIRPRRLARYEATGELTCDELERLATALRLPVAHFLDRCALCSDDSEVPLNSGKPGT